MTEKKSGWSTGKRRGPSIGRENLSYPAFLALAAGILILLYPTVSDLWNRIHQSTAIGTLDQCTARLSAEEERRLLEKAGRYNLALFHRQQEGEVSEEEQQILDSYENLLDLTDTGIMATLEIPEIHVTIPIYHGTAPEILQVGAGHMCATSLPVGGVNTHSAVCAHSGLASARLFTDLERMKEGDMFTLHLLRRSLHYQVIRIQVVEPGQAKCLQISPGEDLVTLITCTPYGINTHRLLVTGRRVWLEGGRKS